VSAFLVIAASLVRRRRQGIWLDRFAASLVALVVVQLILGLINLLLHAPIGLQIIHLLLADLIWITLILLALSSLDEMAARDPMPV
jgi:heme A synthase